MKTIGLIICLPKESKAARICRLIVAGVRVALMLLGAKKVTVNISEGEYDEDEQTVDTLVNITWE